MEKEMVESQIADAKQRAAARGNYLCGHCNKPKKGHKCEYRIAYRIPRSTASHDLNNVGCQAASGDAPLTSIDLSQQGSADSYP